MRYFCHEYKVEPSEGDSSRYVRFYLSKDGRMMDVAIDRLFQLGMTQFPKEIDLRDIEPRVVKIMETIILGKKSQKVIIFGSDLAEIGCIAYTLGMKNVMKLIEKGMLKNETKDRKELTDLMVMAVLFEMNYVATKLVQKLLPFCDHELNEIKSIKAVSFLMMRCAEYFDLKYSGNEVRKYSNVSLDSEYAAHLAADESDNENKVSNRNKQWVQKMKFPIASTTVVAKQILKPVNLAMNAIGRRVQNLRNNSN